MKATDKTIIVGHGTLGTTIAHRLSKIDVEVVEQVDLFHLPQ
jgi:Trk K+ transport system NAD-binding subunit